MTVALDPLRKKALLTSSPRVMVNRARDRAGRAIRMTATAPPSVNRKPNIERKRPALKLIRALSFYMEPLFPTLLQPSMNVWGLLSTPNRGRDDSSRTEKAYIKPSFVPGISMAWERREVRELKPNRYVMIGEEPCRIISMTTSKPGKHGEAKARIEAFGIFDGQKRSMVHPVTHKVRVPMIDRRKAQVLTVMDDEVQLMDLENYETFELPIPEDFDDRLEPGKEVYYLVGMDRRKLTRP